MSDESQITVPPSFVALFIPAGTIKPTETKEVIAQRYEQCEDFAQMLVEHAQTRQWELGITEDDVLHLIGAGLEGSEVFSAAERGWVMTRLAELLGWGVRRGSGGARRPTRTRWPRAHCLSSSVRRRDVHPHTING